MAGVVSLPGPTRLFFLPFFARPNRVPRAEAAHSLRAYARAPAFPAACDWLFSGRAQGLEEIDCPVTIAWGGRDLLLLPRQARYFVSRIPGARLVYLEGLGHTPMYDDPARVAGVILERTTAQSSAKRLRATPELRPARG